MVSERPPSEYERDCDCEDNGLGIVAANVCGFGLDDDPDGLRGWDGDNEDLEIGAFQSPGICSEVESSSVSPHEGSGKEVY